jgi:hypothetical protein
MNTPVASRSGGMEQMADTKADGGGSELGLLAPPA